MSKIICISGATSGIGKACAYKFGQAKYDCILFGRRTERLKEIAQDLEKEYNINVYYGAVDVRDYDQVAHFFDTLPEQWRNINILINNAGLAKGIDTIENIDIEDIHTMVDTNVKGLLYVSKKAIPLLTKDAHVFNLGSIAGRTPYAGGAAYCGTKAAVNFISECMRLEIMNQEGRNVTCINPGLVDTEFQLVRANHDQEKYQQVLKERLGGGSQLKATDISDLIFSLVGKNIPEVTYWHKKG